MSRITPENITTLKENEVFVFGSNLAGIHGAGAALLATKKFGAKWGQGIGFTGQCYAIPTKDKHIKTLELGQMGDYVRIFINDVLMTRGCTFLVTAIGTGLAGYTANEIAPLFEKAVNINNVYLPESFWEVLNKK